VQYERLRHLIRQRSADGVDVIELHESEVDIPFDAITDLAG
jgi:hypothetical protein